MLLHFACIDGPLDDDERDGVDLVRFADDVQPVLASRCASQACHGSTRRPLALYATGSYRIDASRTFFDEVIDTDELHLNALTVLLFADGYPLGETEVLAKPRAEAMGGTWHGGGAVFEGSDDPGHAALLEWLELAVPR